MVAEGKCQLICRWSAVRFPFKSRENRKGVDFFSESKKSPTIGSCRLPDVAVFQTLVEAEKKKKKKKVFQESALLCARMCCC